MTIWNACFLYNSVRDIREAVVQVVRGRLFVLDVEEETGIENSRVAGDGACRGGSCRG